MHAVGNRAKVILLPLRLTETLSIRDEVWGAQLDRASEGPFKFSIRIANTVNSSPTIHRRGQSS